MANYDAPATFYDSGLFYDAPAQPQLRKVPMSQVSLNLTKLNIADLLQSANNIKTAMTGNANFTTPNPPLIDIGTRITTLTSLNNVYESLQLEQKTNLTNRDEAVQALVEALMSLAGYVQSLSGGDAAKIQSAGLAVKGARTRRGTTPDMVTNLSVSASDSAGELDLQWDPVFGAKSYEVQISTDPVAVTNWSAQPTVTKSRTTVSGLTSGTRIWVRVRAINGAGQGAWSDPATKIVP